MRTGWLLPLALAFAAHAAGAPAAEPDARGQDAGLAIVSLPPPTDRFVTGVVTAFARSADGYLFVGSHRLACFDGANWYRCDIPGVELFQSLAASADGQRIWVGAIGAWGWMERDAPGRWRFVKLPVPVTNPEQIRSVYPDGDGAVFVSRSNVQRWDGHRLQRWDLPSPSRLYPWKSQGVLYVYQPGKGLFQMEATGPHLILPAQDLPATSALVSWLHAPDSPDMIGIFVDGAFRYDGHRWTPLGELSAAIGPNRAMAASWVDSQTLAVGTFNDGVILSSPTGAVLSRIDTQSGLADNNVNTVWASGGELWIGTATGCAHIANARATSRYDQRVGLGPLPILHVQFSQGRPYVLTTHRVYSTVPSEEHRPARLMRVDHYWDALWDCASLDDRLWVGGQTGLWEIAGDRMVGRKVLPGLVVRVLAPSALPHRLLVLRHGGAVDVVTPAAGAVRPTPVHLPYDPTSVVETADGRIWVATAEGSVHRLRCDPSGTVAEDATFQQGQGLPPATTVALAGLGGHVLLLTESGVFRLRPDGTGFVPASELAGIAVIAAAEVAPDQSESYWVIRRLEFEDAAPSALVRVSADHGQIRWSPVLAPGLEQAGDITKVSLTSDSRGKAVWIADSNGLARFEATGLRAEATPPEVSLTETRSKPQEWQFAFAPAHAVSTESGLYFQTRLLPVERAWGPPEPSRTRPFTGLAAGGYTLQVRAFDRFGITGRTLAYSFSVPAPWYLRPPALLGWAVLAGIAIGYTVRWRVRRLELQAERLNRLVDERTRELSLSNTAKSEFLENISHEIRNPLSGISGLVQLLEASGLSDRAKEHAQALKACSEDLKRTFDEVLNFSKLEYGQVPLSEREFHLQGLVESVRDMFSVDAALAGSAIGVHAPAPWRDGFVGDEGKIRTIITNFVGNALKYAPGTPVEIHVAEVGGDGDPAVAEVLIEVADRGPGVPPEEQELIFKKFVRGSRARATETPGTGIGLATCRLMAGLMHGSVGIQNPETGTGAIFFLKVPLRRSAANPAPAAPAANAPAVLAVDDQGYQRQLLVDLLQEMGLRAEGVRDGTAALAALAAAPCAVVITDLELPGMSGADLARRIRQLPLSPPPLIIGTSAENTPEAERACLEAEMDMFMPKPHTQAGLAAALAARTTAGQAIDLAALELYARHMPGGLAKAVERYLAVLAEEMADLKKAVATKAAPPIAAAIHRVRSHGALIGSATLQDAAAEMERASRAGQLGEIDRLYRTLAAAASATRYRLRMQVAASQSSAPHE